MVAVCILHRLRGEGREGIPTAKKGRNPSCTRFRGESRLSQWLKIIQQLLDHVITPSPLRSSTSTARFASLAKVRDMTYLLVDPPCWHRSPVGILKEILNRRILHDDILWLCFVPGVAPAAQECELHKEYNDLPQGRVHMLHGPGPKLMYTSGAKTHRTPTTACQTISIEHRLQHHVLILSNGEGVVKAEEEEGKEVVFVFGT